MDIYIFGFICGVKGNDFEKEIDIKKTEKEIEKVEAELVDVRGKIKKMMKELVV